MSLEGKRVLLAGGTGLAGAGALRQLLARFGDVKVRVPFRSRAGWFTDNPRVEYVQADLTDRADCERVASRIDYAVLAAAHTAGAREARDQPWAQVTDNVVLDARLLEALHAAGVRRVVYVGTASVYQDFSGAMPEDQLDWSVDPPAAYLGVGWAKRYAEKLCQFWHRVGGLEILIARLANVYGPCARFDPAQSHFVAALVRKAVSGDDPFVVWGSPQVGRDILYADDFGRAVVAMLEATSIKFDVFNIGSGCITTVGEVADLALRAAGHKPVKIVYDSASPTTVAHRMLDCSKARDLLGWTPETTSAEGVRQTVEWWQANKETWQR